MKFCCLDLEQVINVRSDGYTNGSGLSGTMDVAAIAGTCKFKLKYDAEPGVYPLTFTFEDSGISYTINITIRECYIGEQRVRGTNCLE